MNLSRSFSLKTEDKRQTAEEARDSRSKFKAAKLDLTDSRSREMEKNNSLVQNFASAILEFLSARVLEFPGYPTYPP